VGNFQHFEKHFESRRCATVRLEQNYRSSGIIVAAANSVIDKNKQRLSKTLFTDKGRGEKVIVTCLLWRQRWEENESVG
jgi:DNA helicase-2/ATP-dependent DNA helicase PcrA